MLNYAQVFFKLFAVKGNFAHGWIGEIPHNQDLHPGIIQLETYFHQKSLYGRFGKPEWKWKLYGGLNHQVFWGKEKKYYGDTFTLSTMQAYLYVVTATSPETNDKYSSKIGKHLGSIDLGFEYKFKDVRLLAYRQSFYDILAIFYLTSICDGLNGLSLVNTRQTGNKLQWEKIVVEVLYTKNQAGELWSPPTLSGDEDYYNHGQFSEGWSYKGNGLGTPFICSGALIREGLPTNPRDYFINNRLIAFHFGFEGSVQSWNFVLKTSYSLNYGTFGTS